MPSPLKNKIYPHKAISEIAKRIPDSASVNTLWFYSGDVELALSRGVRQVTAHTTQIEVLNFWKTLSEVPREIYEILLSKPFLFELGDYHRLQDSWHRWPSLKGRAALFFVLSTASEIGLVSRGALNTTHLNAVSYSRVMTFKKPTNLDFQWVKGNPLDLKIPAEEYTIINAGNHHTNIFDYGKAIGPEEALIDHKEIRERWADMSPKTLLVYNYTPCLLGEYSDSDITMISEFGKPTAHEALCKELIIAKH